MYQERVSPIGSEQLNQDSSSVDTTKLGKIEENPQSSSTTSSNQSPMTTIITLNSTNVNNNNAQRGNRKNSTRGGAHGKKEEKPWYDVSDEDVEIQTPDHITSIISVRGSSDEDPF